MTNLFLTIIIPVYKDWSRLTLCLEAMAIQNYPAKLFEIILINNDPKDNMPAGYFIPANCVVITEGKPGSYAARNAGLKIAKGEIIGFTDSDCIPDANWIKNAMKHFETHQSCKRIAGKVSLFFKTTRPNGAELYDSFYGLNQSRYVSKWLTSVTANLFTYKYLFDDVGMFNENLLSGGDFYWGIAASKKGYTIDYADNVVIYHPARNKMSELIKKEKRIGGGYGTFMKKQGNLLVTIYYFVRALYKFLKVLLPNLNEYNYLKQNAKDVRIKDKIYLYSIRHYLRIVRFYEKFLVQVGKKARRE